MTIKVGEVGKIFRCGLFFDVSGATNKEIKLTNPITNVQTIILDARITAPGVEAGGYAANTYYEFTTLSGDFPDDSTEWECCGRYEDGTPKDFEGDPGIFTILPAC